MPDVIFIVPKHLYRISHYMFASPTVFLILFSGASVANVGTNIGFLAASV